MRTKVQVLDIIQNSFSPLECVAELHDYDEKVGFRVYGPDNQPLIRLTDTQMDGLLSGPGLQSIIDAVRRRLTQKGHKLDPWVLPS